MTKMNKMEYPYCVIDGVEYQLEMVNDVIRFPNTKAPCSDLNRLVMDYYKGSIDLQEVWEEYTQTGSSYYMVEGIFSPYGINNHTVTQGKGKCKDMVLHSGDPEVDAQYNYTEEEKIKGDGYNIISRLYEDYYDMDNDEIIELLTELKTRINTI